MSKEGVNSVSRHDNTPRGLPARRFALAGGSLMGFTLLELLVVVALIIVVVSIAGALFLRSVIPANEASAIISLKLISTAQTQFRLAHGRYGDLNELGQGRYLSNPALARGEKSGYLFQVILDDHRQWQWSAEAVPKVYDASGIRSFYIDEYGDLRAEDTGTAKFVPRAVARKWNPLAE